MTNVKFEWDDAYKWDFQELKNRLTSTNVLTLPSSTEGYTIYYDAYKWDFQELKNRLTSADVLTLPLGTEGYTIYYNASRVCSYTKW